MGCICAKTLEDNNSISKELKNSIDSNSINILYMEDTQIHFELMSFMLDNYTNKKINLFWAKNMKEGYKYFKDNRVDMAFIDRIIDKRKEGDLLINQIVLEKLIDINKIIVISSDENTTPLEKYIKKGLIYLKKPVNITNVLEIVDKNL